MNRTSKKASAITVGFVAVAVWIAGVVFATGQASAAADPDPRIAQAQANVAAYCTALADDATTTRQRNTRADLCTMWTRELADLTAVTPTPTPTVTRPPVTTPAPTTQPPVTTTPPATTAPPTPTPTPTTPPAPDWPDASDTGVPAATVLTAYTGPCTITVANTIIDSKTVNCTLSIRANNVVITKSRVVGGIENGSGNNIGWGFTVVDSDILTGVDTTGIGESNYSATRVDISGGNRGGNCYNNCRIVDSYVHDNRVSCTVAVCGDSAPHASGLRAGMNTTYVHNYIKCSVGENCSADLTGYPDFSITTNWTITNNFFGEAVGSYWCAYDGAVGGKPHSNDADNATNIQFRDNVFARGASKKCANSQGTPVSFDGAYLKPGWVFTNNRFEDGVLIPGP